MEEFYGIETSTLEQMAKDIGGNISYQIKEMIAWPKDRNLCRRVCRSSQLLNRLVDEIELRKDGNFND